MLERLLDRAAVAHSVIDDRDQRRLRPHVSVPLVLGTPSSLGSRATADRSARSCQRLERRLDHVVRVRAGLDRQVQRQLRVGGQRAAELLRELVVEVADRPRRKRPFEHAQAPARDVDRARRPGLVHRTRCRCRSARSRPVTERAVERLADADPDVLDRVVRAGLKIAAGAHVKVEAAVAGEQVEHVVEEADPGLALAGAGPVEPEGDLRSRSRAVLRSISSGAGHRLPLSRMRASIDRAWSSKPSARATGAAARASAVPSSIRTSVKLRRKCEGESADANRAAPPVGRMWFEPAM